MSGRVLLSAAILTLLAGLAVSTSIAQRNPGVDYFHLWGIPVLKRTTGSYAAIYRRANQRELFHQLERRLRETSDSPRANAWLQFQQKTYSTGLHPTGTPFFYDVHGSNPMPTPVSGYWLYQWLATLWFAVGCIAIGRFFGLPFGPAILIAGLCLLVHRGVHADMGVANVNRLQVGWFAIGLIGMSKKTWPRPAIGWIWAGLVWGGLVMYKPNTALALGFPLLALAVDRQWRPLIAMLAAAGAMGLFLVGNESLAQWQAWQGYIQSIVREPFALTEGNYALPRLFPDRYVRGVSLVFTLLLVGAAVMAMYRTRIPRPGPLNQSTPSGPFASPRRYALWACAGLAVPLISAPVTWGHYLTLSLPLAIALVSLALVRPPAKRADHVGLCLLGAGMVLTGLIPLALIPGISAVIVLVSIQLGLILMLGAGLILSRRIESAPPIQSIPES